MTDINEKRKLEIYQEIQDLVREKNTHHKDWKESIETLAKNKVDHRFFEPGASCITCTEIDEKKQELENELRTLLQIA